MRLPPEVLCCVLHAKMGKTKRQLQQQVNELEEALKEEKKALKEEKEAREEERKKSLCP
jgi:hypothetical protein